MGFMSFNRIKSDGRHVIKKWQTHDLRLAIHWKRNTAKKESFLPQNYINKTISQLVLIWRWRRCCHWVLSFLVTSTANCWRLKNYCLVVAHSRALAPKFNMKNRAFVDLREAKTCRRRFWRRKRDWSRSKSRLRAAVADQIHFIQLSQKHALKRADLQTRSE